MTPTTFIDNVKVMSKGQVTIPKDVRDVLGVSNGDRITFVVENVSVHIFNFAVYAMKMLQSEMSGEAESKNLKSEEEILSLVFSKRLHIQIKLSYLSKILMNYIEYSTKNFPQKSMLQNHSQKSLQTQSQQFPPL